MPYLPLEHYQRKWMFTHQSMPVSEVELVHIKPMSAARSALFWKENISVQSPDAERFSSQDWPRKANLWMQEENWITPWESDEETLPASILVHIPWQDDVTVYFCYDKYNIIETQWKWFKKYWKNFLFYDDGPILIGRRRKEALWFNNNGNVKLGMRP